jgi:type II secretory pathway component PulJ
MKTSRHSIRHEGFTLVEVLIALGIFMLAVTGLVAALDSALRTALDVRKRQECRAELESRVAYCMALPPPLGTPRVIESQNNHGVKVEESVVPWQVKDAKGNDVPNLGKLTVKVTCGDQNDSAEMIIRTP